jgi:hypothetical protein
MLGPKFPEYFFGYYPHRLFFDRTMYEKVPITGNVLSKGNKKATLGGLFTFNLLKLFTLSRGFQLPDLILQYGHLRGSRNEDLFP